MGILLEMGYALLAGSLSLPVISVNTTSSLVGCHHW